MLEVIWSQKSSRPAFPVGVVWLDAGLQAHYVDLCVECQPFNVGIILPSIVTNPNMVMWIGCLFFINMKTNLSSDWRPNTLRSSYWSFHREFQAVLRHGAAFLRDSVQLILVRETDSHQASLTLCLSYFTLYICSISDIEHFLFMTIPNYIYIYIYKVVWKIVSYFR